MKAFPERVDSRLRQFLAMEYHRRKRHDEAMALIWAEFTESPSLEQYQNLKTHADRTREWPTWREKALASLRGSIAGEKGVSSGSRWTWLHHGDHSELVRIFLWEKDVEAAWNEAQQGGCSNDLWMELAAKLEKDHPEDVLPIYLAQIEPTLARKNNDACQTAVSHLRKVRGLMIRLGREAEFARHLASIRTAHKAKRNFVKLLDRVRW
jgi:uncharacterized Zn finger protein